MVHAGVLLEGVVGEAALAGQQLVRHLPEAEGYHGVTVPVTLQHRHFPLTDSITLSIIIIKSALYLRLKKRKVFKIVKGALRAFRNSSLLKKYEKNEGGHFGAVQNIRQKTKIENFEQFHSAEKCKRGTILMFCTEWMLKNQTN